MQWYAADRASNESYDGGTQAAAIDQPHADGRIGAADPLTQLILSESALVDLLVHSRTREMLPGILMSNLLPRSDPKSPSSAPKTHARLVSPLNIAPTSAGSVPRPVVWPLATLSMLSPPHSPVNRPVVAPGAGL